MAQEDRTAETDLAPLESLSEEEQRRRMLAALALLLLALILVLVKDWQFWFPSDGIESATMNQSVPVAAKPGPPAVAQSAKKRPATFMGQDSKSPAHSRRAATAADITAGTNTIVSPVATTTSRAVLPPLQIEVVAGNQREPAPSGDNSIRVDLQGESNSPDQTLSAVGSSDQPSGGPASAPAAADAVQNASEHVKLSLDTANVVSSPVEPTYPLLAKQMKVQGAVVLQALIGKGGDIQDLKVLSGAPILSEAARQAVMQWRFKPYYQAGAAVETQARITVNFTISTY